MVSVKQKQTVRMCSLLYAAFTIAIIFCFIVDGSTACESAEELNNGWLLSGA